MTLPFINFTIITYGTVPLCRIGLSVKLTLWASHSCKVQRADNICVTSYMSREVRYSKRQSCLCPRHDSIWCAKCSCSDAYLDIRWWWAVSCRPRKKPRTHWLGSWVRRKAGLHVLGEEKHFSPLTRFQKHRLALTLVHKPTEPSRLHVKVKISFHRMQDSLTFSQ